MTNDRYDAARQWYQATAAATRRWRWKRAGAVAEQGLARYAKIGDSISAGQGLQPATQSPPVVMAKLLTRQGLPFRGTSVIMNPRTMTSDSRLGFAGGWSEVDGPTLTSLATTARAGDRIRLGVTAEDAVGYDVRVVHSADSQPFTLAVDGGRADHVEPKGGPGLAVHTLPIPHLAAGPHIIELTTTGPCTIGSIGLEPRAGIALCDFGISMSSTTDWYADGAPDSPLEHVRAWAPDLALIALMTNDAHGLAVPPDRYRSNLAAMVEALTGTCDVVLEVQIPGDPEAVDLTPYRAAVYSVADETGVMVLDLFDRWGDYAAAEAAGLMNDFFHPSAVGATDIAAAEAGVLAM